MSELRVGLSTGSFGAIQLTRTLQAIHAHGFALIEISSRRDHFDYHDASAIAGAAAMLDELGVEPFSLHAPFAPQLDITTPDRRSRRRAVAELCRAADAAAALGAHHLVVHPGPELGGFPRREQMHRLVLAAASLDALAAHCRPRGVRLLLENMLPHLFAGPLPNLLWIFGAVTAPEVAFCFDSGHAHLSGHLARTVDRMSGHIAMVHASDNEGERDDHRPPGEGAIDWRALMRQLAAAAFSGPFMLELADRGDLTDVDGTLEAASRGRHRLREAARALTPAE